MLAASWEMGKEMWYLLQGQPGSGKTTLLKSILNRLREEGARVSGFITEENVGRTSSRTGFDIVAVGGDGGSQECERCLFASKSSKTKHKTGEYYVQVASFERVALPTLIVRDDVDVYLIDEIGRMEMHSLRFKEAVEQLLKAGKVVVGSIAAPRYGHVVAFCEELKELEGTMLWNQKKSNRGQVEKEMCRVILEWWNSIGKMVKGEDGPGGGAIKNKRKLDAINLPEASE